MKITNNNLKRLFYGDLHTDIFSHGKLRMPSVFTNLCKPLVS